MEKQTLLERQCTKFGSGHRPPFSVCVSNGFEAFVAAGGISSLFPLCYCGLCAFVTHKTISLFPERLYTRLRELRGRECAPRLRCLHKYAALLAQSREFSIVRSICQDRIPVSWNELIVSEFINIEAHICSARAASNAEVFFNIFF